MPAQKTSPKTKATKHQGRWHFRGRTVNEAGVPRSHHQDKQPAPITWSVGDTARPAVPTKHVHGQFRTEAPTKRWHRHGIVRNATTGEQVS